MIHQQVKIIISFQQTLQGFSAWDTRNNKSSQKFSIFLYSLIALFTIFCTTYIFAGFNFSARSQNFSQWSKNHEHHLSTSSLVSKCNVKSSLIFYINLSWITLDRRVNHWQQNCLRYPIYIYIYIYIYIEREREREREREIFFFKKSCFSGFVWQLYFPFYRKHMKLLIMRQK